MKIVSARVTPIAFREPPLLNTAGVHEPYALRSIIEVETATGLVGLGESYGEATALAVLAAIASPLPGLDPFDLHGLRGVVAEIRWRSRAPSWRLGPIPCARRPSATPRLIRTRDDEGQMRKYDNRFTAEISLLALQPLLAAVCRTLEGK